MANVIGNLNLFDEWKSRMELMSSQRCEAATL